MIKSGTIDSESNFDPEIDACRIRISLKDCLAKDLGVESFIGEVIVQRSNAQRQDIDKLYNSLFKVHICEDMRNIVNKGNFYESVRALMLIPRYYDTLCLRQAIEEGKDSVIAEMLSTRTHSEIIQILEQYQQEYDSTVKEDIDIFIIEDHKQFYMDIIQSPRDSSTTVDESKVSECVNTLISADKAGWDHTRNTHFFSVLTTNNFSQLRVIFKEYQKREGGNMETVETSIKKWCRCEHMKGALVMWVKSIKNVTQLFSELLYQSVTSLTADSARVIRIVIGRSEIDLTQIKSHYMMQYNKQLQLAVQQKCGNDTAYSSIITMIIKN